MKNEPDCVGRWGNSRDMQGLEVSPRGRVVAPSGFHSSAAG